MSVLKKLLKLYMVYWNVAGIWGVSQVAEELQNGSLEGDEKELLMLLTTPHLKVDINIPNIHKHMYIFSLFILYIYICRKERAIYI